VDQIGFNLSSFFTLNDYNVYFLSHEYKQGYAKKQHGEGIREDVMCLHGFIFIIYHLT
jgi:hypothetical protein